MGANRITKKQDAGEVETDVSAFDNQLGAGDTTVQAALNTLDEITVSSPAGAQGQLQYNSSSVFGAANAYWTGGNLVLDDGSGNSPKLKFVGGTYDDEVDVFLDDSGTAGASALEVWLADDAGSSWVNFRNDSGLQQAYITSAGYTAFNVQQNSVDFVISGDTRTNLFYVDGSADRVGIGTNSPGATFAVFNNSDGRAVSVYGSVDGGTRINLSVSDTDGSGGLYVYDEGGSVYQDLWLGHSNVQTYMGIMYDASVQRWGFGTSAALADWHFYHDDANAYMEIEGYTDNATIVLNSGTDGAGGEYSYIQFEHNSSRAWYLGSDSGQNFVIFDQDRSANVFRIQDGSHMEIFPAHNGSGACVSIGSTTSGVGKLHVTTNWASAFAGVFFNDGNTNTRWGVRVSCGKDDSTGTNYAMRIYDGNGTEQGSIRFTSGTVTYGAFTGAHDCVIPKQLDDVGY